MANDFILALSLAGIFFTAASGLFILTGLCKQVSITQAAYVGVGVVLATYLSRSSHLVPVELPGKSMSFLVSSVIAILLTGIIAAAFGFITLRLRGASTVIASIAVSGIVLSVLSWTGFLRANISDREQPKSMSIGFVDFSHLIIGGHRYARSTGVMIFIILVSLVVFILVHNVSRSPLGRSMRAVGCNEDVSQTCSTSSARTIVSAHFLSGLTAGIVGVLYLHVLTTFFISRDQSTFLISHNQPNLSTFGILVSIQIVAFIVMGGMKKIWITTGIIVFLVGVWSLFADARGPVAILADSGSRVTTTQIALIVSSLVVLLVIHIGARTAKNKM